MNSCSKRSQQERLPTNERRKYIKNILNNYFYIKNKKTITYWDMCLVKILDITKDMYDNNYQVLKETAGVRKPEHKLAIRREFELQYLCKRLSKLLEINKESCKSAYQNEQYRRDVVSRGNSKEDD